MPKKVQAKVKKKAIVKNNNPYKLKIKNNIMILTEINLEGTFSRASEIKSREAIQKHLGSEALIYDEHETWCHGQILRTGYDDEVYRVKIFDGRNERRLHYHDLQKLIICTSTDQDRAQIADFRKII